MNIKLFARTIYDRIWPEELKLTGTGVRIPS